MTDAPSLSTARLSLRALRKATGQNIGWLRDPDVVRFSQQQHQSHTLSSQLRYVNSFGGNSRLWGIYRVDTGAYIGNVSAMHDEPNNVSEVGILIGDTTCWGKGYGNEAWARVCNWLLDKDCGGVRKLEAGCVRSNEAMLKIIRNSGFTQEGERLNRYLLEGGPVSAVLFGRHR